MSETETEKVDLEALGWEIVLDTEKSVTVVTSETQGEVRIVPRTIRAEKRMNGSMVSVEAETPELLETRISSLEAVKASVPPNGPAVLPVSGRPTDADIDPHALETVITPEGNFTEAEWSQRHRTDTIVTSEGQQHFSGVAEENGPPEEQIAAIDEALAAIGEQTVEAENERTGEEPVPSEQITYDTADTIDAPGQSAGGTLVVPEGVTSLDEAAAAQSEISQAAENERVTAATEPAAEEPAGDSNATAAAVTAADELGVDIADVEGTGSGGKVTKGDVESYADVNPA